MEDAKRKLTLDQPETYQIKVPGNLHGSWIDWGWKMVVTVKSERYDLPVTTITGVFDQAALQGLLRRLYSLGLPLISVIWVEGDAHL